MLAAATSNGVVIIEQNADRWRVASRALHNIRVEAIARNRGAILAATEQGLYESDNTAETWTPIIPNVDMRSLAVAADGAAFAGADNAALYRRRPADEQFTEVLSFKNLPTYWSWTFPVSPHLPNLRSIAASPTHPNRIYVGVEVGGVMLTEDGGETWREAREGIHPDIHGLAAAPGDPDNIFAVTGVGFFRSNNGARSWESRSDGLDHLYTIAIASHPTQPHRLIASATNGRPRNWRDRPQGACAKVYHSPNGGDSWSPLMTTALVEAIDALAVDDNNAAFAGTHGGDILALLPNAEDWTTIATGLPPINALAIL